ncbi:MAG: hypothetical protein ACKVWR_14105 [Acidimicrobiales bacterium]
MADIYRLLLRSQLTRARLLGLGSLGALCVILGAAIGSSNPPDRLGGATRFVDIFGLTLLVPVVSLVLASSTLGDLVDDGSLVYLWLRPIARWRIAVAAYGASLTAVLPLVLAPIVVAAALTGAGGAVVRGAALATAVGVAAYCAVFVGLGLRTTRSLPWGLAYILIWEGFVANASKGASRLALRAYTRSILSQASDVALRLGNVSPGFAVGVPLAVAAVGVLYAGRRLRRMDVP